MADTSLVSRVKTTAGTRRNDSKKTQQKQQERRATSAIWRISAELDKPKRKLSKINLNIDAGKLVLAMFLNQELFE